MVASSKSQATRIGSKTCKEACYLYRIPYHDLASRGLTKLKVTYSKHREGPIRCSFFDSLCRSRLFLFVTGHDPDDRQPIVMEWLMAAY